MNETLIHKDKPYVYYHLSGDDIFYIGCGKNDRFATYRGRTKKWQEIVAEKGGFTPKIVKWFDSTEEALAFEKAEIKRLRPKANGTHNNDGTRKPSKKLSLLYTNIRIRTGTHERLKKLAEKKRQTILVVLDELV